MLTVLPSTSSTGGVAVPRRVAAGGHGGLLFTPPPRMSEQQQYHHQGVGEHCVAFQSDTEAVHYSVMAGEAAAASLPGGGGNEEEADASAPLPVLLRLGTIRFADPIAQPCFVTAFDTRWDVLVSINTATRQLHAVHSFPPPGALDEDDDDDDELLTGAGDTEPSTALSSGSGASPTPPPVVRWETNGVEQPADPSQPVMVEALAASGGAVAVVTSPGGLAAHRTVAVAALVAGEKRRGDRQPACPRLGVVTSGLLSVREAVGDVGPLSLSADHHGTQEEGAEVSVVVVGALGGCLIARFESSAGLGGVAPVYTACMSRRVLSPELAGRPVGLHMSCASEATWMVWLPDDESHDGAAAKKKAHHSRSVPRSNVSPADLIAGRLFQPPPNRRGSAERSKDEEEEEVMEEQAEKQPCYGAGDGATRWNEIAAQTQHCSRSSDSAVVANAPVSGSEAAASSAAVADSLMLRRAAARMSLHLVTVMFADLSAAPVITDAKMSADVLHPAHAPGKVRATDAELTAIGVGTKGVVAVSTWCDVSGAWACSVVDTSSALVAHRPLTLASALGDDGDGAGAAVVLGLAVQAGCPIALHGCDGERSADTPRRPVCYDAEPGPHVALSRARANHDDGGGDDDSVPLDDGAALAAAAAASASRRGCGDVGGYVSQLRPLMCPPVAGLRIEALREVPPAPVPAAETASVAASVDTATLVAQMGQLMAAQIARLEGVITQRFDGLERRLDRLESLKSSGAGCVAVLTEEETKRHGGGVAATEL